MLTTVPIFVSPGEKVTHEHSVMFGGNYHHSYDVKLRE